jgi:hypothetical protein
MPKLIKKSKQHLEETEWSYKVHLLHSIKQSNKLIIAALKSYIHGVFPCWYKADGPITIIKMYHSILKIKHVQKIKEDLTNRKQL